MFLLATSDARPEEVDVTALWEAFPSFDVASAVQTCKMCCRLHRLSQPQMERHFRIICLCCSFLLVVYNELPLLVALVVHFDDVCKISYLFWTFQLASERGYFMGYHIDSEYASTHSASVNVYRLTPWIPWSFRPTRRTRLQISVDGRLTEWRMTPVHRSFSLQSCRRCRDVDETTSFAERRSNFLLVDFSAGNYSRCRRWGWGAGNGMQICVPLYLSIVWVLWGLVSFLLDFRVKMAGQKVYPPEFEVASEEAKLLQSRRKCWRFSQSLADKRNEGTVSTFQLCIFVRTWGEIPGQRLQGWTNAQWAGLVEIPVPRGLSYTMYNVSIWLYYMCLYLWLITYTINICCLCLCLVYVYVYIYKCICAFLKYIK